MPNSFNCASILTLTDLSLGNLIFSRKDGAGIRKVAVGWQMAALSLMYLKCWKVREGAGKETASTTQQFPASPEDGLPASFFTPSWSCPLHLAEL